MSRHEQAQTHMDTHAQSHRVLHLMAGGFHGAFGTLLLTMLIYNLVKRNKWRVAMYVLLVVVEALAVMEHVEEVS